MSYKIHRLVKEKKIIYQFIPPHSSHILQPLDNCWFANLKKSWKTALEHYGFASATLETTKSDFPMLFQYAWKEAYSPDAIRASFRNTGIHPWDQSKPDYSKTGPSRVFKQVYSQDLDADEQSAVLPQENPEVDYEPSLKKMFKRERNRQETMDKILKKVTAFI